jgi:hypothetical protein
MTNIKDWLRHARLAAIYGLPFVWGVGLFLFLNVTNPLQNGPLSVLTAFILIYLFVTSSLYAAVFSVIKVLLILKIKIRINMKTTYYLTSVIALAPVFLLALNTLNQLDAKDVILVLVLISLGCFYVLRRSSKEVV